MRYDDLRAAVYDREHAEAFAEAPAVADALVALLDRAASRDGGGRGRVLELGVGTGRLALPLAERGVEVCGIDDSAPMVEQLRAKPGGEQVPVAFGSFELADELVEGPFSLVFVAFNTFFELASQEAQVRCLAGVARLLTPGGLFAVEALAPDLTRLDQSVGVSAVGADRVVLQATRHDPATQIVDGADVELTPEGSRLWPWTIRYTSVAELDLMARLAGLALVERRGGWGGGPFTAATPMHVSVYGRPAAGVGGAP